MLEHPKSLHKNNIYTDRTRTYADNLICGSNEMISGKEDAHMELITRKEKKT